MRTLLAVFAALLASSACKKEEAKPAKLKKLDFKVGVDERGRMLPEIQFFDEKHNPYALVGGSYTLTLARPDGTVLCSLTRSLAKEDYNDKKSLKVEWQDAACPPDPASDEIRITIEVKTGDKPEDAKITRDKTTPTKFVYRHLSAKKPPEAPVGSGSAPAPTPVDPTKLPAEAPLPEPPPAGDKGSAAAAPATDQSATASTDKPATDKPATDKPAADKPATDTPAADKPAADKATTKWKATEKPAAKTDAPK